MRIINNIDALMKTNSAAKEVNIETSPDPKKLHLKPLTKYNTGFARAILCQISGNIFIE